MKLNEPYLRQDFTDFINQFLPDFEKDVRKASFESLGATDKVAYLGKSKKLDLQVFELTHKVSPNARVALATDGFRIMKQSASFRALIAYHTDETDDWRLSLMTLTPEPNEKGKVTIQYSNPRRYSFFLGPDAKINTPYSFLIKKGAVSDFEELQKRFSLEVVNKEFYQQIAELYTQLVGGVRGSGQKKKEYPGIIELPLITSGSRTNHEFAVRLLGRIIFCWFLREKKSEAGLPLVSKELLSLASAQNTKDFYHSKLEPLFFEVLNKSRESRKEEYAKDYYAQAPYLNGGLFSPQADDFYNSDEDMQGTNCSLLKLPDRWFEELFEVLERYNFTVDENTSVDIDLSIDPEMLGRIFENLLAEINPETGISARKSTGSYYTPRTIVEYMVDESLYQYLKEKTGIKEEKLRSLSIYDLGADESYPLTEEEKEQVVEALSNVTILDPACGSGAFPIGALQKIVFILQRVDPEAKLWFQKQITTTTPEVRRLLEREFKHKNFDYIRKLGVIRKSIFGVDIQPIATEISRLRCFLTLVVDGSVNDDEPNRGVEPLPNLDFKFVTANALIGLPKRTNIDKKHGARTSMFEADEGIDELKEIRDMFFNAPESEREQLKPQFKQTQEQLFQKIIDERRGANADLTTKLTGWDPFSHEPATWFDPEWMFGVKDGFDIVIANPPYVQFQKLDKNFRELLREHAFYESQSDLWYFFVFRGYEFLKNDGTLSYIVSNYFLQAGHGGTLRKFITDNFKINTIINFTDKHVFENVGVHNSILLLQKGNFTNYDLHYYECNDVNLLEHGSLDGHTVNKPYLGKTWLLGDKDENRLINKIMSDGEKLGSFAQISNGIKSGEDSIYILNKKEVNKVLIEEDLLRNYLKNSDIHKYYIDEPSKQIIYPNSHMSINDYPQFKKYISQFKTLLEKKWTDRGENSKFWMLYRARENIYLTGKNLIIVPYRTKNIGFTMNSGCLSGTDTYLVMNNSNAINDFVLLAMLNSKLVKWLYEIIGKKKGNIYEIATAELSEIPIILDVKNDKQKQLEDLVKNIFSLTETENYLEDSDKQVQVKKYETQIDQLVYKLYNLTPGEIEIVEGNIK